VSALRSRTATIRSTTARDASSSEVNSIPIPGAGRASGDGADTHFTTPVPRTAASPPASKSSNFTGVPTGRGSRVRTKKPPRETFAAKRSTSSSTVR
jgi:hypothetical protein